MRTHCQDFLRVADVEPTLAYCEELKPTIKNALQRITVEYVYEDHGTVACINRVTDARTESSLELPTEEREKYEAWLMEHRYHDDHTD